jgi:hypothetical protein
VHTAHTGGGCTQHAMVAEDHDGSGGWAASGGGAHVRGYGRGYGRGYEMGGAVGRSSEERAAQGRGVREGGQRRAASSMMARAVERP